MRFITARSPNSGSRWLGDVIGGSVAIALGLVVLAHLAASPRSWVLFYDGDSLLFPLVNASIRVGQAQHWDLTSPLFLLEAAVYIPIGALGLPVQTTLLLDGLVNWLALYAVVRMIAAQLRVRRAVQIATSVLAIASVSFLALCESSASHDALELASLLITTTYYSGTVVAVLGAVALTAVAVRSSRPFGAAVWLGGLVAFAVLSNPLFIAWAVVPLMAVAALTMACRARTRIVVAVVGVLVGGSAIGMLARVPFQSVLVQNSASKIRPDLAADSARYYGGLLADRLTTVPGVVALAFVIVLLVFAGLELVLAIRQRWLVGTVLAGIAFIGPILVAVGSIALGTFAARYLEPAVFMPPLALVVAPRLLPALARSLTRVRPTPVVAVGGAVFTATLAVASVFSLAGTARQPTASIACAVRWVSTHDQYGAGQYWTIRAVKAYSPDPRRLIQTDANGAPYAWLSNTADLRQHTVSFSINSSASGPLGAAFSDPQSTVRCGDFTIATYASAIPLGTPHH